MSSSTNVVTQGSAGAGARVHYILAAVVLACCVVFGFLAYAFLAPTTYETHAEVTLKVPSGQEGAVHPIADSRSRLERELRSPASLKQVAKKLGVSTPGARLSLARSVERDVKITTQDGRSFDIACLGNTPEAPQRLCQVLAQIAVAVLPKTALRDDNRGRDREKVEDLLEFLAEHPELSHAKGEEEAKAADTKTGETKPQPADDSLTRALTQQRRVALAELQELQQVDPNNPYADDLNQELKKARARLQAIDAALAKRRTGLETKETKENTELDKSVISALAQRINQLSTSTADPANRVRLKASITHAAELPSSPIHPDRTRLMILGALAAVGVLILGLGAAFAVRAPPGKVRATSAPAPTGAAPHASIEAADALQAPSHDSVTAEADTRESTPPEPLPEDAAFALAETSAAAGGAVAPRESATVATIASDQRELDEVPQTDEAPRTQVGGFESTPPAEAPSRPGNPISVKGLVAVEASDDDASGEPESEVVDAPRTLIGGAEYKQLDPGKGAPPDSRSQQSSGAAQKPYTPPARNITRRLGSLSWLDQAELTGSAPQSPVSTRYSYVSSRPPPPTPEHEQPREAQPRPHQEVLDVQAEPITDEPITALALPGQQTGVGVQRNPPPIGWRTPETLDMAELARTVLENKTTRGFVLGVTARSDLLQGKSRLAASLSFSLEQAGQRHTLLMEGDFQDPKVHRVVRIEMPMWGGLSQQLQQRLAQPSNAPWQVVECSEGLDVMAEGFIRSPGAILSLQFEQCLKDLRNIYDVIVIDGPALSSGSECRAFADLVDGVVLCTPPDRPGVQPLAQELFSDKRFIATHPGR